MIGYLHGEIAAISPELVMIDVNGVGYNVRINEQLAANLPSVGTKVKIYTYTYVKEDAFLLYGFGNADELELFKQLIAVNGIGPKGALAILSVMSARDLRFAIYAGDAGAIAKAPGVGKKTAERVILDLKDKVSIEETLEEIGIGNDEDAVSMQDNEITKEAVLALVALGYGKSEAAKAVQKVSGSSVSTTEELLKLALKHLI